MKTLFYNARLVDANLDCNGAILVDGDKIASIYLLDENGSCALLDDVLLRIKNGALKDFVAVDCMGLTLMPSFVDMHAHFRYPGLPQKEDLSHALNAAVAGGFGTLLLMPNTKPIVSSQKDAVQVMQDANALQKAHVIQAVSITKNFDGKDTSHLQDLCKDITPVISEDGFDVDSSTAMFDAMKICSQKDIIVSCHSEDVSLAKCAKEPRAKAVALLNAQNADGIDGIDGAQNDDKKMASALVDNAQEILALAEDLATERNLVLAQNANCNIHIAHVSTARSLDAVRRYKNLRPDCVTCEVTPHHLSLSVEKLCAQNGACTEFVNPPIRHEHDRLALIDGIKDGTVDCIATDHAPHTLQDKKDGACGFSGLETAFSLCYTALVLQKHITLSKLSCLMSANPAKRLGRKTGLLKTAYFADFVLVDTAKTHKICGKDFFSKGKYTPVDGLELFATVVATYFCGKRVYPFED